MKWALIVLAGLVVLAGAALAALPFVINTSAFQAYVSQAAAHALGRPVRFQSLAISGLPVPTVKLRGLDIAEDSAFGPGPFVSVAEGRMRIRLRPLLSGRVELTDLTLDTPRIELIEDARGRWNWASLGPAVVTSSGATRPSGRSAVPASTAVLLSRVSIVNGSMQYRRLGGERAPISFEKVNVTVSQPRLGRPLRFEGDAVATPGDLRLAIRDGSLTPALGRSLAEMPLRATLDVGIPDVAPLGRLVGAAPAIAGALSGRVLVTGTLAIPVVTGTMTAERLVLSEERAACKPRHRALAVEGLRAPVALHGTSLQSGPVELRVARGTASFNVSMVLGSSPVATLGGIAVKGVQLEPIFLAFHCGTQAVTGPLDLLGAATVRLADPARTASGAGRLRIGPGKVTGEQVAALVNEVAVLAGMVTGLGTGERGATPRLPLDFDSITATYTMADGVAKTDDLVYQSRELRITGAGTLRLEDARVDMALTLVQGRNEVKGRLSGTPGAFRVAPTSLRVPDSKEIRQLIEKLLR